MRRRNIRFLAYNTRYLILPWVQVPHLASHLLARMTRMLSAEWEKVYGHAVYFAETFVDTDASSGYLLSGGELGDARAHAGPRQG